MTVECKTNRNRPGETLSLFDDKGGLDVADGFRVEISAKWFRDCAEEMAEEITTADSNPRNYNRLLRLDNISSEGERQRESRF